FVWPGAWRRQEPPPEETWWRFLLRPPLSITLSVSIAVVLPPLAIIAANDGNITMAAFAAASLIAGLAGIGASRSYGVWPTILSAITAVSSTGLVALILAGYVPLSPIDGPVLPLTFGREIAISLLLGAIFTFLGFAFLRRHGDGDQRLGSLWAILMS